jgi:DNA-binding transcriptional regulator YiaG
MSGKELVEKVLEVYGMTLPEFAKHIDLPKTTMQTWLDNNKVPRGGEIMLNLLIENKKLKEQVEVTKQFFSLYGLNPK